jgi:hypothetical protein
VHIKNKVKFLYKKKQNLNSQLYYIHLYNANICQHTWNNIEESINQKLQQEMTKVHHKQHKIHELNKQQKKNEVHNNINYNRVVNNTNIDFTNEELQLLTLCGPAI